MELRAHFHCILFFTESNRRTTNKKALQNVREKQQKQRELLPKDASEVGDIEDIYDNKNEPVLEGKMLLSLFSSRSFGNAFLLRIASVG